MKSEAESKVTVQLKNGAYVDPQSGLDKKAHVFKDGKDLYTAVLSKADVQQGTNAYYKIQVLEADKSEK
jgi:poly [ADP-ribose] polymerase